MELNMSGKNARQFMLANKDAHGSGVDLEFPEAEEIEANMKDYDDGHKIQVYGDGSYTTPQSGGLPWVVTVFGFQTGTSKEKRSKKERRPATMDQPMAKLEAQQGRN